MSQNAQMDQSFLTMKQVMKKLGLSRPTVYKLIDRGLPVLHFGRAIRFNPVSLERWLEEHEERAS